VGSAKGFQLNRKRLANPELSARVVPQFQAQPGFFRECDPAGLGPGKILVNRLSRQPFLQMELGAPAVGHGRVQVHVVVGSIPDRQVESLGHRRRLHPHGKAADEADGGIEDIYGTVPHHVRQFGKALPLAGRNWNRGATAQLRQQMNIVVDDGLLEPHEIVGFQLLEPAKRRLKRQQAGGVDHELDLVANGFAHRLNPSGIYGRVLFTMLAAGAIDVDGAKDVHPRHMNLLPCLTLRYPIIRRFHKLLGGIGPQAACEIGGDCALCAAEETPDRRVEILTLDVPQCHIDGAGGGVPGAGVGSEIEVPKHQVHQALSFQGIPSLEEGGQVVLDEGDGRRLCAMSDLGHAHDAVIGLHEDEVKCRSSGGFLERDLDRDVGKRKRPDVGNLQELPTFR